MNQTEQTSVNTTPSSEQPLEDRVNNRSHRPDSDAFRTFMTSS